MDKLKTCCLYYKDAIMLFEEIGVDAETKWHSKRVAHLFVSCISDSEILEELDKENGNIDSGVYVLGALLHDIGKTCIPLEYLNKTSKLTTKEFDAIKHHAELGKFVAPVISSSFKLNLQEYVVICKMAQLHHENCNGTGYPYGLNGETIPIYVKILAVLDVYDALVSRRSYKKPMSKKDAMAIIVSDRGKKFDKEILDMLINKKVIPVKRT